MSIDFAGLSAIAAEVVESTLERLPPGLREEAAHLPVSLEPRPSPEMEEDGLEPDILGLFVGESFDTAGETTDPLPGQILLFLENIWEFAERDEDIFREEVAITLLHEIGHYFGWDEEDLYERGLE